MRLIFVQLRVFQADVSDLVITDETCDRWKWSCFTVRMLGELSVRRFGGLRK